MIITPKRQSIIALTIYLLNLKKLEKISRLHNKILKKEIKSFL